MTPTERMPVWLVSKYFYREMNPLLRYALVPFLFLFNVSVLLAVLAGLDLTGVWSMPVEVTTAFLGQFSRAGTAVWFLLAVNVTVTGLLYTRTRIGYHDGRVFPVNTISPERSASNRGTWFVSGCIVLVGIPLYFIRRDIRKTIQRFGVFEASLTVDAEAPYEEAASEVFAEPEGLTLTERLLTIGREPDPELPDRTVLSEEPDRGQSSRRNDRNRRHRQRTPKSDALSGGRVGTEPTRSESVSAGLTSRRPCRPCRPYHRRAHRRDRRGHRRRRSRRPR